MYQNIEIFNTYQFMHAEYVVSIGTANSHITHRIQHTVSF